MQTLGLSAPSSGISAIMRAVAEGVGAEVAAAITAAEACATVAGAALDRTVIAVSATTVEGAVALTVTGCCSLGVIEDGVIERGEGVGLTVEKPRGLLIGIGDGANGVVSILTGVGADSEAIDSVARGAAAAVLIAPNPRLPVICALLTEVVDCSAV